MEGEERAGCREALCAGLAQRALQYVSLSSDKKRVAAMSNVPTWTYILGITRQMDEAKRASWSLVLVIRLNLATLRQVQSWCLTNICVMAEKVLSTTLMPGHYRAFYGIRAACACAYWHVSICLRTSLHGFTEAHIH